MEIITKRVCLVKKHDSCSASLCSTPPSGRVHNFVDTNNVAVAVDAP